MWYQTGGTGSASRNETWTSLCEKSWRFALLFLCNRKYTATRWGGPSVRTGHWLQIVQATFCVKLHNSSTSVTNYTFQTFGQPLSGATPNVFYYLPSFSFLNTEHPCVQLYLTRSVRTQQMERTTQFLRFSNQIEATRREVALKENQAKLM